MMKPMDAQAPNDPRPRDGAARRTYGGKALRTMGICFVLGLPLLLAFGLGVLVWAYGLVAGLCLAVVGIFADQRKLPAVVALVLAGLVAGVLAYNRHSISKPDMSRLKSW